MRTLAASLLALSILPLMGCRQAHSTTGPEIERLKAAMEAVRPLHRLKGPAFEGDWLFSYPEPGQTFEQYLVSRPNLARTGRRVISVRPLGELTPDQLRIVDEGKQPFANLGRGAEQLFGYSADEVVGKSLGILTTELDQRLLELPERMRAGVEI